MHNQLIAYPLVAIVWMLCHIATNPCLVLTSKLYIQWGFFFITHLWIFLTIGFQWAYVKKTLHVLFFVMCFWLMKYALYLVDALGLLCDYVIIIEESTTILYWLLMYLGCFSIHFIIIEFFFFTCTNCGALLSWSSLHNGNLITLFPLCTIC